MSIVATSSLLHELHEYEPDKILKRALKKALLLKTVVTRVNVLSVYAYIPPQFHEKYTVPVVRRGIRWLKDRVADADLIASCKREHLIEHVHDHVQRFMLRNTDSEDHHLLKKLDQVLRESIRLGVVEAELGGGVFRI